MSSVETPIPDNAQSLDEIRSPGSRTIDWGLVRRQLRGILRLELRRNLLGRRALAIYFMAFVPMLLAFFWAVFPATKEFWQGPSDVVPTFAKVFAGWVSTSIFLSALVLFMSCFRSEILQRSLHFYLLAPVRRDVLVAGKYLAALTAMSLIFVIATAGIYLTMFGAWGPGPLSRFLFQGPGFANLFAYLGIAVLACVGYGALFLLAGLVFRNPAVAGGAILLWELFNFLMPAYLKKLSVIFYLQSLYPVPPVSEEIFAVLSDPVPAWLSVPGLLLFSVVVLAFAGWRARRMELGYGGD